MKLSQFTVAERNAIRDAIDLVTIAAPEYHFLPNIYSLDEAALFRSSITKKLSSDADHILFGDELDFIVRVLDVYCDRSVELSVFSGKVLSTTAAALARYKIVSLSFSC